MFGRDRVSGMFITFEGPEGAGKTTLISQLKPVLETLVNKQVIVTREPGGNAIAERIREVILDTNNSHMDSRTEALLYAASRRQHLVEKVLPAIDNGDIVLCDRFVDSSIAYQGYARQIGVQGVEDINFFATDGMQPDITFYLDIDVEVGLQRIQSNRQDEINRLDLESLAFHQAVRQGYLEIAHNNQDRVVVLDATKTTQALVYDCLTILQERFPNSVKK